jgi:hypothetical protein
MQDQPRTVYMDGAVTLSRMTRYLRFVVVALIVQFSPSISFAAGAKGWVQEDCYASTFHLRKNDYASAGQELILRLHTQTVPLGAYLQGVQGDEGFVAEGKRCSASGNCEEATHAKIWLNPMKGNMRHISGRYAVNFGGQHLEGEFVVKYRKPNPQLICN